MIKKIISYNSKKLLKDYIPYFIALTASVCVFFAYNSFIFSEEAKNLSAYMKNNIGVKSVTIVVMCLLFFLIFFSTKVLFDFRSKEFSAYITMGFPVRKMVLMVITENVIVTVASLIVGCLFGSLLTEAIKSAAFSVFKQSYNISFHLNGKSFLTAAVFFIVATVVSACLFSFLMSRKSPLKLNKSQVKIETIKKKYYPVYIILTVVSLTAGALNFFYSYSAVKAVVNRNEPEFKKNIIIIIFLFVIFVVGTVISLFGIVCVKASESKFAYRGLNLFSLSHFTANVKSLAVITIAVSVILSASFSLFTLGSVYAGVSEQKVINNYPFDIMLYVDSDRIKSEKEEGKEYYFNETIQSIKNQFEIKDFCGYEIYTAVTGENTKHIFESSGYEEVTWSNSSSDVFIKLSDYNEIRKVLGDKQLALSNNECAIHSQNYAGYIRGKDIDKLNINGKFYQLKTVNSGAFAQDCTETRINGEYGLIIVVPDSVCDSLKSYRKIVLINTERKISAEPQKYFENCDYKSSYGLYLESLLNGGEKRIEYRISDDGELEMQSAYNLADVFVQSEMLEIKRSVYLDFMLSFFYLAFIFSIITAVILMLYKISKINIEKYEYSVLDRLGVEKRLQKRAVLKEVLLLFGLPVAFALLSDVMLFTAIWRNSLFMSVTRGMLFEMFVFSQLFVIVLYFLFLAVTYFFEKENVVSDV